jgi:hypothetical protein
MWQKKQPYGQPLLVIIAVTFLRRLITA